MAAPPASKQRGSFVERPRSLSSALTYARPARSVRPVLVNGAAGVVIVGPREQPFAVIAFTVIGGKIIAINALADPERLAQLDLSAT